MDRTQECPETTALILKIGKIGLVTGNGASVQEKKISTLPSYELFPNHILLIVNSAPSETDIAPGINIRTGKADEARLESEKVARYLTAKKLELPVAEKYLLTLRKKKDRTGTSEGIVDVASTYWPSRRNGRHVDVAPANPETDRFSPSIHTKYSVAACR